MGNKYMTYKENIQNLLECAAMHKLRGTEYRVLIYLIAQLSFDEYRCIDRYRLCTDLEIKKSNLAYSIQNIIDAGFLLVIKATAHGKNLRFKLPKSDDLPICSYFDYMI